jgi:hypothetical protein
METASNGSKVNRGSLALVHAIAVHAIDVHSVVQFTRAIIIEVHQAGKIRGWFQRPVVMAANPLLIRPLHSGFEGRNKLFMKQPIN